MDDGKGGSFKSLTPKTFLAKWFTAKNIVMGRTYRFRYRSQNC